MTTTTPTRRRFSGTLNFPEPVKGGATALRRAGIDWTVSGHDLRELTGKPGGESYVAAVRSTDDAIVGVNGTRHQLVQNEALADLGDTIIEMNDTFRYVGGGSMYGGTKTYLVLRSNHVLTFGDSDDRGFESILLVNDHDGNCPVVGVGFVGRLACTNQFSGLTRGRTGQRLVRIAHTKSADWKLQAAKDTLRALVHEMDETELELRRLLDTPMSAEAATSAAVGPAPTVDANARAITAWENRLMAFRAELSQPYNQHIAGTALGAVMAAQAMDEHASRSADRETARLNRVLGANFPTMNRVLAAVS